MSTPIGIQLYTLRHEFEKSDPMEVIKRVAAIGYKGVEGAGYGMSNPEFKSFVNGLGMSVTATWGGIPTAENAQELIDQAHDLGTNLVIASLGPDDFATEEACAVTAEKLNAGVPLLKAAGLRFCLHNHWWEFEKLGDKLKIDHVVDAVPDVDLQLDIYWCTNFGANNPVEQMQRFRPRVPICHVKDGSQVRDDPMTAVGSGSLDIPAVLAAADPSLLQWGVVELDACATDMWEAVEQSYRYLVGNGLLSGNVVV